MAGINALGRGQDQRVLTMFIQTIAQTLGPEALLKFINASEAIKRLAAAQGIEVLNLVKSDGGDRHKRCSSSRQATAQSMADQMGQLANAPLMDPSKNPQMINQPPEDG